MVNQLLEAVRSAVRSGNVNDVTRLLNSRSEEVRYNLLLKHFSCDGEEQQTLLNIAALSRNQELVKALLNGLNTHQRSQVFMKEVCWGHVAPIEELRIGLTLQDQDNGLRIAASQRDVRMARALLEGLTLPAKKRIFMMMAASRGDVTIVGALLEDLPSILEGLTLRDKKRILMMAASRGDVRMARALLEGLPSMEISNPDMWQEEEGFTPLMAAAINGHAAVIEALLSGLQGDDRLTVLNYQLQDDVLFNGETALMYAVRNGHAAVIDALLAGLERDDRLSLLNQRDGEGRTALMHAASNGDAAAIGALLAGFSVPAREEALNQFIPEYVMSAAAPGDLAVVKAVLNYLPKGRRVKLVKEMLDGLVKDFFIASAGNGAATLNENNINTLEFLFKTGYVSAVSEDTKITIKDLATKNRMPFSVFNLLANAVNTQDYNSLLGYFRDENNYTARNIRQSYDELLRMSRQALTDFKEVEAELNNKLVNIDESFSNVSYRKILQGLDSLFFRINDINELAAHFKRVSDKLGQILSFDLQSSFVARMIDGYLVGKYKLSEELIEQIVSNSDEPLTQDNLRVGIVKGFRSVIFRRMDRLRDQNTPPEHAAAALPPAPSGTAPEDPAAALPPAPSARAAGGTFANRVGQRRPPDPDQPAGSNTRSVRQRTGRDQNPGGGQGPQGR